MSIQKVIQESIAGNPLEMKEALAEELRARVRLALEAKMDDEDESDEDEDEDMKKEEFESLDEISKKTLGSYVKKASSDMANNAYALGARDPLKKPGSWEKAFKRKEGIAKATDRLTKEEVELDEVSKKTLGSYINKSAADISHIQREIGSVGTKSPDYKDLSRMRRNRKAGIATAVKKLTKESFDLDEETKKMKDGYYVTNQRNSEVTHDKPFNDSKSAISHANKGENKTGYVHRVHKVKDGKIDKQWEYNGGHHEGGWEHFSDFKGDAAHQHMRNIPKHFFHGHSE